MSHASECSFLSKDAKPILALHSCSNIFGIAVIDANSPERSFKSKTFDLGRNLSNRLFSCIEEILPYHLWRQIARIGVATGPGGFTGTRLSITMGRTIAQQLNCPIDGISSFELMAPRLLSTLKEPIEENTFWIVEPLQRKGIIAGKYQIITSNRIIEVKKPSLLPEDISVNPKLFAIHDVAKDIELLANYSLNNHIKKKTSSWDKILPIYATSPIE